MTPIVDAHLHIIVPEILREADPSDAWRPRVFWEDGKQVIDFAGKQLRSAVREFVDIDGILAEQDRAGVDRVILAPWVSLVRYNLDLDAGIAWSRRYNESLARLAQVHPDRVVAIGTVPLQDPDRAARELEELMGEPGMVGVEIAASVGGDYLGHERFRPFWAAAEETGAFVFIHPTTRGFNIDVMNDYYLWNTVGNPLETAITAAHMAMSGLMESHPRLKVMLAHGGGALLILRGRLAHSHNFQPQARAKLNEPVADTLRRFYYDTVVHDDRLLRQLIDFAGADHVLLGSDYPFDMGLERPSDAVGALSLSPDDEAAIVGGNAMRLLGLEE